MVLEKLWDDIMAGPHPEQGLGKLRGLTSRPTPIRVDGEGSEGGVSYQRSMSMPITPATPGTPVMASSPSSQKKDNVWRSVFNPGSNLATKKSGSHELFDKPLPNSPTVYDWLYSGETRSSHRGG